MKKLLDQKHWDKPVSIESEQTGYSRIVTSTRAAAESLLYRWPKEGGPAHRAARVACIAVLKGEQPPEHAREAFIQAAKEAGILIEDEIALRADIPPPS